MSTPNSPSSNTVTTAGVPIQFKQGRKATVKDMKAAAKPSKPKK
jgi:hypothetical protein